jgi:hypothetical protein
MRPAPGKAGKPDQLQELQRARPCGAVVAAADLHREQHVAQHRSPRQQGRSLKDEGKIRARPVDLAAVDLDAARARAGEAGDDPQQCGLAAAARSEQRHQLAPLQGVGHVRQRDDLVGFA